MHSLIVVLLVLIAFNGIASDHQSVNSSDHTNNSLLISHKNTSVEDMVENGFNDHSNDGPNEETIDGPIDGANGETSDERQTKLEILKPNLRINSSDISLTAVNNESRVNCTPAVTKTMVNTLLNSTDNETSYEWVESRRESSFVILVNSSTLFDYLQSTPNISQSTGSQCVIVIFYYKWCTFSAAAAKHLNALGRIYPQFYTLAIDAYSYNSINMRFGLVGVPSILFFHNGKIVGKLNDTEPSIDNFVTYIHTLTGLSPTLTPNITEEDYLGPLSITPQPKFDYLLLFSWFFSLACFSYMFAKSTICKTITETIRNTWREAEAQHEHLD